MKLVRSMDLAGYTNAKLIELDSNLYYYAKVFVENLKKSKIELTQIQFKDMIHRSVTESRKESRILEKERPEFRT
jgi:hypothetical protein